MYGTTGASARDISQTSSARASLLDRRAFLTENESAERFHEDEKAVFRMETQHRAANDELDELTTLYGPTHWRVRTFKVLHSSRVILLMASLLMVDVLVLIVGLILDGAYPECASIIQRVECNTKNTPCTFVLTDQGEELQCGGEKTCVDTPDSIERVKAIVVILSLVILLIFLSELTLHIVVVGGKRSMSNVFLMFDLLVVLISIWLEIMTALNERRREQGDEVQAITVPFLIASRSWRLLRIGHGTYKEAHDMYQQRLDRLMQENAELKRRLNS